MIRKVLNSLDPRRRSLRTVSQLLQELESSDSTISERANKTLTSIYYCQFDYQPSLFQWAELRQYIRKNRDWVWLWPVTLPLLDALDGGGKSARLFAIKALAANKVAGAMAGIVAALQDESSEIRAAAAISLFHYRDPKTVEPLIAVLSDSEETPRQYAANTLSHIGDPRARAPLLKLTESRCWRDREVALYAVGDVCDEESLPIVRAHLQDSAKRVRKAARSALARYDRRRRDKLAASWRIWWRNPFATSRA